MFRLDTTAGSIPSLARQTIVSPTAPALLCRCAMRRPAPRPCRSAVRRTMFRVATHFRATVRYHAGPAPGEQAPYDRDPVPAQVLQTPYHLAGISPKWLWPGSLRRDSVSAPNGVSELLNARARHVEILGHDARQVGIRHARAAGESADGLGLEAPASSFSATSTPSPPLLTAGR